MTDDAPELLGYLLNFPEKVERRLEVSTRVFLSLRAVPTFSRKMIIIMIMQILGGSSYVGVIVCLLVGGKWHACPYQRTLIMHGYYHLGLGAGENTAKFGYLT